MALSDSAMSAAMVSQLEAQGFTTTGDHAKTKQMCDALAAAIVAQINATAEVYIGSGSSGGTYKVL